MALFATLLQQQPSGPTFARIKKLRTELLAFRLLYYVWAESIVSDFEYDKRERELKQLVEANPAVAAQAPYADICPSVTVGSSDIGDYPVTIEALAGRLWQAHEEYTTQIDPAFLSTD